MTVSPSLLKGFQILRVGERNPKDKRYAADEFVAAPPGTIVAPRPRGMKPTLENAISALADTAVQAASAAPAKQRSLKSKVLARAQGGTYVVAPGDNLWSIWSRSNTGLSWAAFKTLNSHLGPNYALIHPGDTVYLSAQAPAPAAPTPAPIAPTSAPTAPMGTPPLAASSGEVFAGSDIIQQFLAALGGESQVSSVGIPSMQQQWFETMGYIIPALYGITDPAEFRAALAAAMSGAPGAAARYPTMTMQQMTNVGIPQVELARRQLTEVGIPAEQRALFEALGFIAPSLYGTSPAAFQSGLEAIRAGGGPGTFPTFAAKEAFGRGILRDLGGPLPGLQRQGVPYYKAFI